jgi:SAM-dependent methyltransferase
MSRPLEWLKVPLLGIKSWLLTLIYRGDAVYCPICETSFARFLPVNRQTAQKGIRQFSRCPKCSSLKRHRFAFLFLKQKTDLFENKSNRLLHIAPERCLSRRFKKALGRNYLSGDLTHSLAMKKMDITHLDFADHSFDVVFCSHVLEHVPDDRKALSEFRRVLTDDGHAVIMVPITVETTYEDPSITTPEGRLQAFGQEDHVRRYGPDFIDRLMQAGFEVQNVSATDILDPESMARFGLAGERVSLYFCSPG